MPENAPACTARVSEREAYTPSVMPTKEQASPAERRG